MRKTGGFAPPASVSGGARGPNGGRVEELIWQGLLLGGEADGELQLGHQREGIYPEGLRCQDVPPSQWPPPLDEPHQHHDNGHNQ